MIIGRHLDVTRSCRNYSYLITLDWNLFRPSWCIYQSKLKECKVPYMALLPSGIAGLRYKAIPGWWLAILLWQDVSGLAARCSPGFFFPAPWWRSWVHDCSPHSRLKWNDKILNFKVKFLKIFFERCCCCYQNETKHEFDEFRNLLIVMISGVAKVLRWNLDPPVYALDKNYFVLSQFHPNVCFWPGSIWPKIDIIKI